MHGCTARRIRAYRINPEGGRVSGRRAPVAKPQRPLHARALIRRRNRVLQACSSRRTVRNAFLRRTPRRHSPLLRPLVRRRRRRSVRPHLRGRRCHPSRPPSSRCARADSQGAHPRKNVGRVCPPLHDSAPCRGALKRLPSAHGRPAPVQGRHEQPGRARAALSPCGPRRPIEQRQKSK
jgi:hypothetical protein